MRRLIDTLVETILDELKELRSLRTTFQRRADILGYFDHPGISNGPTEAIEYRSRHLIVYADAWYMPTFECTSSSRRHQQPIEGLVSSIPVQLRRGVWKREQ